MAIPKILRKIRKFPGAESNRKIRELKILLKGQERGLRNFEEIRALAHTNFLKSARENHPKRADPVIEETAINLNKQFGELDARTMRTRQKLQKLKNNRKGEVWGVRKPTILSTIRWIAATKKARQKIKAKQAKK